NITIIENGEVADCYFCQAEDGIRDRNVTEVQTCALPIFIEEKGIVKNIQQNSQSAFEFKIKATKILEDINIGDSISIDGVCLTVTNFTDTYFQVDIMPETVKATSIKTIKENQEVNLERAMLAATRLGGHFVTGH